MLEPFSAEKTKKTALATVLQGYVLQENQLKSIFDVVSMRKTAQENATVAFVGVSKP
jgi:pyridoxal/pyridoxine/pyridoxamine kinase